MVSLLPLQLVHAQQPPIFVLNSLDADVSVIDAASYAEIERIPTGKEPHHLYLTPDEKSLMVANAAGNSLTLIDPRTAKVQRVIRNIADPYHLRFSPDMKWFITASNRLNYINIYSWDGNEPTMVKRISAPRTPSHLFIDSKSEMLYSSLQDSDELIAIHLPTQQVKWKISVGRMPADVYVTPDDKRLLVGLTGSDSVQVFDVSAGGNAPPKLITQIKTGAGAHAFRAKGDKRHVLVSNRVANTISMIDTQELKVVETYAAPGGPDCMELSADGKILKVTSRWAKKLTIIDLESKKMLRQIDVGRSPHGVWTLNHASRL
jgi:YVTN family beta-propeller protein